MQVLTMADRSRVQWIIESLETYLYVMNTIVVVVVDLSSCKRV